MAISIVVQSVYTATEACPWFAAWEYLFCISTYCWVCCISFNMLMYDKSRTKVQALEKYYHLISWGFPLGFTTFLVVRQQFGLVVAWQNCWIINAWDNPYYYAFYFVPLCFTYIFMIVCFAILMRKMKRMGAPVKLRTEVRRSAILYLGVFAFSWLNIWTSTTFVPIFGPFPIWFVEVGSFTYPMQGFLNSLVYGLTGSVRHKYASMCGCGTYPPPEKESLLNSSIDNLDFNTQ